MSRDLRRYSRQTSVRLVIGFILLLFIIGASLIYLIYGPQAAVTGVLCLLAASAPIGLIWLIMNLLDWIVKKNRDEDD